MTHNIQLDRLRPVIKEAISSLQLPPLIKVESDLYRQHVSYRGAVHWKFELPEGDVPTDYERLEHVGDALIGAEAAVLIHEMYPRLTVGVRTILKCALVENITLAQLARMYDVPVNILTSAAQASSIQSNKAVQACVFEAYVAAVYEERGGNELRRFLRKIWEPLLPTLVDALREIYNQSEDMTDGNPASVNYVGKLGEWCVQKGAVGRRIDFSTPERTAGPSHAPLWHIKCTISSVTEALDDLTFESTAGSVAKAKNASAQQTCKHLGLA
ncbi:hypothetical protein JCM3774_005957 [Rhodotorula dairenensis]